MDRTVTDVAPIADLIHRAEQASLSATTKQANKALLKDMSIALVAQAQRIAMLEAEKADKPRIFVP